MPHPPPPPLVVTVSLNLTTDLVGTPGLRRMDWGGGGVEEHPVVGEVLRRGNEFPRDSVSLSLEPLFVKFY